MKRNRVRLTESQLHRVIKESVKKVLREMDFNRENERESDMEHDWESQKPAWDGVGGYYPNIGRWDDENLNVQDNVGVPSMMSQYEPEPCNQTSRIMRDVGRSMMPTLRQTREKLRINNR